MDQLLPHFQLKLVNGLQGDPAIYGFSPKTGDALLFDMGTLDNLSHKELLKVRMAMISHTHVDHFIGFDRLLRVNIPHRRCVEFCGPSGLTQNILGKLSGYTWNLIDPEQVQFIVHEIADDGQVTHQHIKNADGKFKVEVVKGATADSTPATSRAPGAVLTKLSNQAEIAAIALDHGTSSVAYTCRVPGTEHVDAEALAKAGLQPGPWIRELQSKIAAKEIDGNVSIDGRPHSVNTLKQQFITSMPGRSITYVTDAVFSWSNLQRLKMISTEPTLVICEANYRDEDVDKAFAKKHLTTRQAGLIAAYLGAANLQIFHVSSIYPQQEDLSVQEAAKFFANASRLTPNELHAEIDQELQRLST